MALTGILTADFSGFLKAIEQAENKMVDLNKGAAGVSARLDTLSTSFSGRKIIQEATLMAEAVERAGGVSRLTAAELERVGAKAAEAAEKMRVLGYEVPPGIDKLAQSVKKVGVETKATSEQVALFEQAFRNPVQAAKTAALGLADSLGTVGLTALSAGVALAAAGVYIVKLTVDASKAGAALDDLSDKTGLSVPTLSRYSNALAVTGGDINQITDAIFKLEKGIGENTDAFAKGASSIGLSTAELKAAGPDKYLELVAVGLAGIQDPAERAAAGAALFGKSYSSIAASLNDLAAGLELTNDIVPWTADQAAAAERFDQQIASMVVHVKAFGESIGRDLIPTLGSLVETLFSASTASLAFGSRAIGITGLFNDLSKAWNTAAAAVDVFRGKVGELPPELEKLRSSSSSAAEKLKALKDAALDAAARPDEALNKWKNSVAGLALKIPDATAALEEQNRAGKDLTDTVDRQIAASKKAADEAKKLADEQKRTQEAYDKTAAALERWNANAVANALNADRILINLHGLSVELNAGATGWIYNQKALDAWWLSAAKAVDSSSELMTNLRGLGAELPKLTVGLSVGQSITKGLSDSMNAIPGIVVNAFTGGGGLLGGLKAIGSTIGSGIGKNIADGMAATAANAGQALTGLTKAFASALPVIGSLIGPVIELFGKLFDNPEKRINPIREAFVQAAGGLEALNQKAAAAGVTLDALLHARNEKQYQTAIDELTKAFARQEAQVKANSASFATLFTSFAAAGGTLPDTIQKSIQKLIDMGKVTGDVVEQFKLLSGPAAISFKTLSDIAQRAGADLKNLGPAFESARLSDLAQGIVNDFHTLEVGLGSVDEAIQVMKKPINDLVNESLKAGKAIPENFRPWIEQLAKTGQLVDANGDKIEDISGLKFADPIVSEFQKIVDKLQELIDKISGSGGITDSINGIPDRTVNIGFNVAQPDVPDFGWQQPIYAAGGYDGVVTKPTLFVAGESGAERVSIGSIGGGSGPSMEQLAAELRGLRAEFAAFPRSIVAAFQLAV